MGLDAPPVLDQGKPITGRVSTTFTPNTAEETYALDDMGRYADTTRYPPLDPASAANTLTVRDGFLGAPRTIARDQWQFGRMKDGQLVPDISALYLKGGYEPGHFYELSYEAKGAVVAGLGFAALRDTTLDGRDDAKVPDNVRIYLIAGTQHVPGGYLPSQGPGQQKPNGNEYAWAERALLVAMDRWVRDSAAPPPSAHPRLADKTLVPRESIEFPAVPGVRAPLTIPSRYRADLEGPHTAHPLPLLVPQVDRDGNELSGIRLPNVAVPLATYTGWNFRNPAIGQPGEVLPLAGSYIPLPLTRAARDSEHDPRFSVEERYGGRSRYEVLVTDRGEKLVEDGYMLQDDLD